MTLVVLSFNQSKTRAEVGRIYPEMVQRTVPERTDHECLLYDTDHCLCLSGDRNDHRNGSSNRIQGMKQKWKTMYMGLTNIPMMNAEIVMGVVIDASLYLLFT